ncbi:MAG TPA: outer membrane beta-barrel protein [Rhodanobacteraceae bacterium]
MLKQLTALALLTGAACLGTSAQAAVTDVTGWFINGGVGSAHYDAKAGGYDLGSASGTSYQFNGGWRSQFVGIEGGYTDLGSHSEHDDFGDSYHASAHGYTLGVNLHINPVGKWYISARTGLFFWRGNLDASAGGASGSASDHHTNGYFGLGTGVDFNQHWSLGVNGDYYQIKGQGYKIDNTVYSAILEYRF